MYIQQQDTCILKKGLRRSMGTSGNIITEIFHQNQKARSPDTAKAYAEMYLKCIFVHQIPITGPVFDNLLYTERIPLFDGGDSSHFFHTAV